MTALTPLTPFGKALRKHRIDLGVTQRQVAAPLGIKMTLLSAYETGRRNVPEKVLQGLQAYLNLTDPEAAALRELAFCSRKDITIDLKGLSDRSRALVAGFARSFERAQGDEREMQRLCEALGIGGR